jgi:hypothetical protein
MREPLPASGSLDRSSLLIYSTGRDMAWMLFQNGDVIRCFVSHEELRSEFGELEKHHEGVFQQPGRSASGMQISGMQPRERRHRAVGLRVRQPE